MLESIKSLIPLKIKRLARNAVDRDSISLPASGRAFVFLAADYGNIGDLAISSAQDLFLRRYAEKPNVVVVPISKTRSLIRSIKKQVAPSDLVTIIGGGNMGALYPDIEELRQLVIRSFPRNRIVCFPQTLDWEGSPASSEALDRIVEVYSCHDDLYVFARESVSLAKLKDLFQAHRGVRVGFSPDIVLSATAADLSPSATMARSGILLCMREDRERVITEEQREVLSAALARTGLDVERTDTHAGGSRLSEDRCSELPRDKVDQFRSARLVVTDRLHGMILAVVAGTPCLVLPNSNHKIRQTYQDWLSDNPHVVFLAPDQLASVEQKLEKLLGSEPPEAGKAPVEADAYADLKNALALP